MIQYWLEAVVQRRAAGPTLRDIRVQLSGWTLAHFNMV